MFEGKSVVADEEAYFTFEKGIRNIFILEIQRKIQKILNIESVTIGVHYLVLKNKLPTYFYILLK